MNFHSLLHTALDDARLVSLEPFRPELILCGTIVALLLARLLAPHWKSQGYVLTLAGMAAALWYAAPICRLSCETPTSTQLFTGMLLFDGFSVYMRSLVLVVGLLLVVLARLTRVPEADDAGEFFVMVLGAMLGMCLMISANHMLMVFVGIEMASVPSYALAGMLRHRKQSSEASLKFAIYGAATAGIMLYGISLLVGALGSAHLPTMATQLANLLQDGAAHDRTLLLVLGGLMVMVGLAFKLSAVPFQFWAPDVFEGATAEVAAFLSVASKAAALALLVRLTLGLGLAGDAVANQALAHARQFMAGLVGLLAAVTCTYGNLAAYGQTNMKRLLAYSTIAQAGYMMMPVAAALALAPGNADGASSAVASIAFYAGVYLFMNLAAFAFVAFLRNRLQSEEIDSYTGLVRTSPGLALALAVVLLSLVGLPPLAGFVGKYALFASLANARLWLLLVIGGLNTAISLFYYLRVVKVMVLAAPPDNRPAPAISLSSPAGFYVALLTLPVIVLGVFGDGLFVLAERAARTLLISTP